jgi:hypothetical protein
MNNPLLPPRAIHQELKSVVLDDVEGRIHLETSPRSAKGSEKALKIIGERR